jgi:hypothetical protein
MPGRFGVDGSIVLIAPVMLKPLNTALAIISCALFFASCSQSPVSEAELIKYVADEDNGLTRSTQSGEVKISVSFQPTDLLVARELRGNASPTADQMQRAVSKYSDQYYFVVRLSQGQKELVTPAQVGLAGFSELLQTLSFEMGDKVSVIDASRDTLEVADYIYNRTFGAATSSDLLFAFRKEKTPPNDDGHLELNLEDFGLGTGRQAFQFELDDINDAPQIFSTHNTSGQ